MSGKVAFHNLGCKVNSYETECMIKQFTDHGYFLVPFDEMADIYIVNTCTVTSVADKKSRQMLHRAKRQNPNALVVAIGCYAQADPDKVIDDELVDIVIGNENKSMAYELITSRKNVCTDISKATSFDNMTLDQTRTHTRAFIKVQDGCNQFCSYCLIPYVRGRVRSRKVSDVLDEVKGLVKLGCKEIVLTGIHLSSYGLECSFNDAVQNHADTLGDALADLIMQVSEIMDDGRIRLGSLEPRIITPNFVQKISNIKNLCPHFHLSLQSGCDETLKRMNRKYTTAEYENAVKLLRGAFEHPAITTDVIVGFPGETDEEFNETYEFLKKINLYEMHIFKYSVRKGTKAESLPNRVAPETQEKRSDILLNMSEDNKAEFAKYYNGKSANILIEEIIEIGKNKYATGYNEEYVKFTIPYEGQKIGDIVQNMNSKGRF